MRLATGVLALGLSISPVRAGHEHYHDHDIVAPAIGLIAWSWLLHHRHDRHYHHYYPQRHHGYKKRHRARHRHFRKHSHSHGGYHRKKRQKRVECEQILIPDLRLVWNMCERFYRIWLSSSDNLADLLPADHKRQ